jgi:hypothetical protein
MPLSAGSPATHFDPAKALTVVDSTSREHRAMEGV